MMTIVIFIAIFLTAIVGYTVAKHKQTKTFRLMHLDTMNQLEWDPQWFKAVPTGASAHDTATLDIHRRYLSRVPELQAHAKAAIAADNAARKQRIIDTVALAKAQVKGYKYASHVLYVACETTAKALRQWEQEMHAVATAGHSSTALGAMATRTYLCTDTGNYVTEYYRPTVRIDGRTYKGIAAQMVKLLRTNLRDLRAEREDMRAKETEAHRKSFTN